jgi:hypothetical protein
VTCIKPKVNDTFELVNKEHLKEFDTLELFKNYLEYEQQTFTAHDTIIIESGAGTGKTTNTAMQLREYMKANSDVKILSLVNYISLAKQQIKTFKQEGITLNSYQNLSNIDMSDGHYVVCLNSLMKLSDDINYDNTVLYIDEVSSLIKSLSENELLNRVLKRIYLILMELINKCKKVIVSDANITDNVFNVLRNRAGKRLFINNTFKKFQYVPAIHAKNEYKFIDKMKNDIAVLKYFLCGADSCETITRIYHACIAIYVDDPVMLAKFILITSKTKYDVYDATEQFEGKFVFYSPSIVTGVDFSINYKQRQYLYIKGKSLNVLDNYQQATRTRNMSELVYYIKPQKMKQWNLLQDIELMNKNMRNCSDKVLNLCSSIDINDKSVIVQNTYFKVSNYNDYLN